MNKERLVKLGEKLRGGRIYGHPIDELTAEELRGIAYLLLRYRPLSSDPVLDEELDEEGANVRGRR
jgi:hypothetical protein